MSIVDGEEEVDNSPHLCYAATISVAVLFADNGFVELQLIS